MKNNKGFTLLEILSVIIILGVLMIIAIPAVTKSIFGSRSFTFSKTADKYIEIAMADITSLEYSATDKRYTYYIPTKCLKTDNDIDETSYGKLKDSYVVVTYSNGKNDYYYTGFDETGHGFLLTYRDFLNEDNIKTDLTEIDTTIGIGNRDVICIYSSSCDKSKNIYQANTKINEEKLKTENIIEDFE